MKTKVFLFFIAIASTLVSFGYTNLRVQNPHSWGNYAGVIEEAEITARPMGAFVEYSLTLTISAKQPVNESTDAQLEIVLDFDLPANTMITDSWLWIEGKPKRADILDRWTASSIYEEIVNRRKDPSLLVKNGATQYSINIYPMKIKESRKFKIVYLSPAKSNGDELSIEIPSNIFNASADALQKITAYIFPSDFYPQVSSNNIDIVLSQTTHPEFGNGLKTEINKNLFNTHGLKLISSNNEKIKVYKYGTPDEGYYQLSFVPSKLINIDSKQQKICYLIDYDQNYTNQSIETILTQLSTHLKSALTDNDQFNIIFSNMSPTPVFNNWAQATDENIQTAFNNAKTSNYSNLISLIGKGLDFINNNDETGKIIVITNNCSFANTQSSNSLLADIDVLNTNKTQIDVIDYTTSYYNGIWMMNNSYYNNAYLFVNLTRKYSGEYVQFLSNNGGDFKQLLENAIYRTAGKKLSNIDIYTSSTQGFCYGRFNVSSTSFEKAYNFNSFIHHTGRYKGAFPNNLEVSFELEGELYHYKADLSTLPVAEGDSVIKTIWSGLDMQQLESQGNTNQIIGEIINQSLHNRILSYYTAFLCVEDPVEICEECGDVNTNDPIKTGLDNKNKNTEIKVYPNPFTNSVSISLPQDEELVELKIFNMAGQCVKTITITSNLHQYTWDGTSDNGTNLKEGIYLVKATFKTKVFTTKIVKK